MLILLNGLYYNKNSPFYTLKKHIAPTKVDKTSPYHKYYLIHTEGVLTSIHNHKMGSWGPRGPNENECTMKRYIKGLE